MNNIPLGLPTHHKGGIKKVNEMTTNIRIRPGFLRGQTLRGMATFEYVYPYALSKSWVFFVTTEKRWILQ